MEMLEKLLFPFPNADHKGEVAVDEPGDGGGDDIDYDEYEGDAPVLVVVGKTDRGHYFCRQEGNSPADEVVHQAVASSPGESTWCEV